MQCMNILKRDELLGSRALLRLHLSTSTSTRRSSRLALDPNSSSQLMK
jgi:hypothetical protein